MSVKICIEVENGKDACVIFPEIKVSPENHTVPEMNIATRTVNYAVQLAAELNQAHDKLMLFKEDIHYVS